MKLSQIKNEIVSGSYDAAFKKLYGDRAFSWRGKGVVERNLNILNKR